MEVLDVDKWLTHVPTALPTVKKPEDWAGRRGGLDVSEKRKVSEQCWDSSPGPSSL
jgi:hypothetical protein